MVLKFYDFYYMYVDFKMASILYSDVTIVTSHVTLNGHVVNAKRIQNITFQTYPVVYVLEHCNCFCFLGFVDLATQ